MTVTSEEVLALRDKLKADNPDLTDEELVQGVRTSVHAILQEESPAPYQLPPAEPGRSDPDYQRQSAKAAFIRDPVKREAELKRIHEEHVRYRATRGMQAKAAVTIDDQLEFEEARIAKTIPPTVTDAHHFAQFKHNKGLWERADAIVAAAGVK